MFPRSSSNYSTQELYTQLLQALHFQSPALQLSLSHKSDTCYSTHFPPSCLSTLFYIDTAWCQGLTGVMGETSLLPCRPSSCPSSCPSQPVSPLQKMPRNLPKWHEPSPAAGRYKGLSTQEFLSLVVPGYKHERSDSHSNQPFQLQPHKDYLR